MATRPRCNPPEQRREAITIPTIIASDRVAPSGVRVRFVDFVIEGVPAQTLCDAIYYSIAPAFDLVVRDADTLRIEWTDSRILSTDDITRLIPNVLRAAVTAALIPDRARSRALTR